MTAEVKIREALGVAHKGGLKRRAKLIAANTWGSTAYYPAEVLERDGGRVFTAGVQMFEDHLSDSQEWERPEGSLKDLVGKLVSDAEYLAEGEDGPGLYADVEFYESYGSRINEIANDIGISVRAHGLTEDAEMDGRYGPVLVAFLAAKSVDIVTRAGAGGKLTSIIESDRELAGRPIISEGENSVEITKEDFDSLKSELLAAVNGISAALTEALKPGVIGTVSTEGQEVTPIEESDKDKKVEVEIDHAAIVEALRTNDLPSVSTTSIIADLREGKTLDDAVKNELDRRNAYLAPAEGQTLTVIREGAGADKKTGLAFAVDLLS